MYDPAALLMTALGLLLAGAVILVALFCVYKLLDRVSRFVVFAALFISLFAISWVQGLATAPGASGDVLLSMAAALNAFGQAALAFIGNGLIAPIRSALDNLPYSIWPGATRRSLAAVNTDPEAPIFEHAGSSSRRGSASAKRFSACGFLGRLL